MVQRISLMINNGNFSEGFSQVKLGIYTKENEIVFDSIVGDLPPSSRIPEVYKQWQGNYLTFLGRSVQGIRRYSVDERQRCWEQLKQALNEWLNSDTFGATR